MALEVVDSVHINKPPEVVFAFLDDPTQYPKWVTTVRAVERRGPDDFHVTLKEGGGKDPGMAGKVTMRQPPLRHLVHLADSEYDVDQEFALVGDGGQTRLTYTRRLDTKKGGFGLMAGMVRRGTAKAMRSELDLLKRILEG